MFRYRFPRAVFARRVKQLAVVIQRASLARHACMGQRLLGFNHRLGLLALPCAALLVPKDEKKANDVLDKPANSVQEKEAYQGSPDEPAKSVQEKAAHQGSPDKWSNTGGFLYIYSDVRTASAPSSSIITPRLVVCLMALLASQFEDNATNRRIVSQQLMTGSLMSIRTVSRRMRAAAQKEDESLREEVRSRHESLCDISLLGGLLTMYTWFVVPTSAVYVSALSFAGTLFAGVDSADAQSRSKRATKKLEAWTELQTNSETFHNEMKHDYVTASVPIAVLADQYNRLSQKQLTLEELYGHAVPDFWWQANDEVSDWATGNATKGIVGEKQKLNCWFLTIDKILARTT